MDRKTIPGAADFSTAIEKAINSCRACAVILGPHGWGSFQRDVEFKLIHERRRRDQTYTVIPVLLPASDERELAVLDPRYMEKSWVDFRGGLQDEDAFWALAAGVRPEIENPDAQRHLAVYRARDFAARWERAGGKDRKLLYRGDLLLEAQRVGAEHPESFDPATLTFLGCSNATDRLDALTEVLSQLVLRKWWSFV